ncbi:MAG: copper-binding protein [Brevundimonas sp.]|uniref:copper-binding protein n=1 Tax=Brevundimonas sp. TaxID=1871086 RepID=UPI002ABAD338|nr:copper-binding protein [Brevundimonas sp.]MDZ4110471.1 copper-binding protein [Brevundimonas sp.]
MKRPIILLTGLAAVLAACGQQAEPETPAIPMAQPGSPTVTVGADGASSPAADAKTADGAGVITAVDPAAATITINHEAIRSIGWPAMTMKFKASPAVLQEAAVGDRIQFDLTVRDGAGEVTAIYPH